MKPDNIEILRETKNMKVVMYKSKDGCLYEFFEKRKNGEKGLSYMITKNRNLVLKKFYFWKSEEEMKSKKVPRTRNS